MVADFLGGSTGVVAGAFGGVAAQVPATTPVDPPLEYSTLMEPILLAVRQTWSTGISKACEAGQLLHA